MFGAFLDCDTVSRYVKSHFSIQGGELLTSALEKGKGCILVTAHWGAVEFIPWVLFSQGFPTSVILECATTRLARSLQAKQDRTNTQLISSGHGISIFLRALESLKANRVLMTQCDEVDAWRRRKSHHDSALRQGALLRQHDRCALSPLGGPRGGGFPQATGTNRYTLILEDVSVLRSPESTARECLTLWERYVRDNPEQWYQWKKLGAMVAA